MCRLLSDCLATLCLSKLLSHTSRHSRHTTVIYNLKCRLLLSASGPVIDTSSNGILKFHTPMSIATNRINLNNNRTHMKIIDRNYWISIWTHLKWKPVILLLKSIEASHNQFCMRIWSINFATYSIRLRFHSRRRKVDINRNSWWQLSATVGVYGHYKHTHTLENIYAELLARHGASGHRPVYEIYEIAIIRFGKKA